MNGVGPWWFPDWLTKIVTWLSDLFFDEASWQKHDEGYSRGNPSRWRCDWLFLRAMLRDARRARGLMEPIAYILAFIFWASVRIGGWASYNYKG